MIQVIDVTNVYHLILGYNNVCYPYTDKNGKKILGLPSLEDKLLLNIKQILINCPIIDYAPASNNI